MSSNSSAARGIWEAGVRSVYPRDLVAREVVLDGAKLSISGHRFSVSEISRLVVVGAGKATGEMVRGLQRAVGDRIPMVGWVNVPEGGLSDSGENGVRIFPARPIGVNEPTEASVAGTQEILQLIETAGEDDLCVALISGGGSALLSLPAGGITLQDKLAVIRCLSAGGADITELNTVRKHLSEIKGGGLLAACQGLRLVTLVLSDVLGDPLDLIASGPTVPDPSSPREALEILKRFDPMVRLPAAVYGVLGDAIDAFESDSELKVPAGYLQPIVIGSNQTAVDTAAEKAREAGYSTTATSAKQSEGNAESVGREIADWFLARLREDTPSCLVSGGEPTVVLASEEIRGLGGRNQQLVLACYQQLCESDLSDTDWSRITLLSGGTDGEDGPTDAAGAMLNVEIHRNAERLGLDVADHLARNDAYHFFQACDGLLMTGPTGTNVCDLRVAVVKAVGSAKTS